MIPSIQPTMQHTEKSCGNCAFFHTYDWSRIKKVMTDANVRGDLIEEFGKLYTQGDARCTLKDSKVPRTDWCKGWKEVTEDRPTWPQTDDELKKAFPKLL